MAQIVAEIALLRSQHYTSRCCCGGMKPDGNARQALRQAVTGVGTAWRLASQRVVTLTVALLLLPATSLATAWSAWVPAATLRVFQLYDSVPPVPFAISLPSM